MADPIRKLVFERMQQARISRQSSGCKSLVSLVLSVVIVATLLGVTLGSYRLYSMSDSFEYERIKGMVGEVWNSTFSPVPVLSPGTQGSPTQVNQSHLSHASHASQVSPVNMFHVRRLRHSPPPHPHPQYANNCTATDTATATANTPANVSNPISTHAPIPPLSGTAPIPPTPTAPIPHSPTPAPPIPAIPAINATHTHTTHPHTTHTHTTHTHAIHERRTQEHMKHEA
ncbi:hypothetical protein B484DRAFT_452818 [Ochromonadaceae sp. CCMP2298]|nr:hypothetical protein B484DRAFT_452818 [Ochromonadaceae sp. CCMP2298]